VNSSKKPGLLAGLFVLGDSMSPRLFPRVAILQPMIAGANRFRIADQTSQSCDA
jgi:hypothetical protein